MTIAKGNAFSLVSVLSTLSVIGLVAGCSATPDETVDPRLDLINQSKSALSSASITSITGTYGANCDGRNAAGTDTWTLSVSGGPASDELSVRKNDSDCVLTLANVITADGTYVGAPAIALDTADTYQGSASAFALAGQPIAFYGNAKISAVTFAANFTISLLVSDTPNASDEGTKGATFATQSATLASGTVPASDYTLSLSSFGVTKDVNNVVQSVAGYAQLAEGTVTGQDYAIYEGTLDGSSTIEQVDTAFANASATGLLSALTTLELPATDFGLVSVDLDTSPTRTIIIRNTDQGVYSYQLMLITFIP
jgi:hypothetical protein